MTAICQTCSKPATLRCPTCIKKGLPDAHFCSQECFKSSWNLHKLAHSLTPVAADKHNPWTNYRYTGSLRPVYPLSPKRAVPDSILKPDYALDPRGYPKSEMSMRGSTKIQVLTPEEIEKMRVVCKLGREVLEEGAKMIKVGTTTDEIDRVVHDACMERNCYPSPLNYYNFPKSCCTSVNEVICHGIPDQYELQDGDICNIDVSVYHDGFHSDLNETYLVGNVDENGVKLVKNARRCLDEAIKLVKPGALYRDLGNTISNIAESEGFSVVRTYCGHGINSLFHAAPNVPHYAKNKAVGVMKPGHCFTIEPMISEGVWQDEQWPDGWTAVTRDGKRSAQFEETLLVTDDGVEILTAKF
ncbi:Methionine aminopeptidase 1 [Boothiomyces sp. JEL0838]|nr:Methionine aminopeptidase 1 [Boothiomyces sp. JEL0838]